MGVDWAAAEAEAAAAPRQRSSTRPPRMSGSLNSAPRPALATAQVPTAHRPALDLPRAFLAKLGGGGIGRVETGPCVFGASAGTDVDLALAASPAQLCRQLLEGR